MKGEERGDWRHERVAEGEKRMVFRAAAASGPQKAVGFKSVAIGEVDGKPAVRLAFDRVEAGLQADGDTGIARGVHQANNDGFGGIGNRQHATVGLSFEVHPAQAEPFDRFTWAEPGEWTDERAAASRVALGEFAGIEAGVGDIATPTARDADLREDMAGFFQNGHAGAGIDLGGSDGSEKACCTTTDNNDSQRIVHRRTFRRRRALVITETLLKLMARPAIIGLRRVPVNGYRTPAAMGTPRAL